MGVDLQAMAMALLFFFFFFFILDVIGFRLPVVGPRTGTPGMFVPHMEQWITVVFTWRCDPNANVVEQRGGAVHASNLQ